MNHLAWILAACLAAGLVVQTIVMRRAAAREREAEQERQAKLRRDFTTRIEQSQKQVAMLMSELVAARQALQQVIEAHGQTTVPDRQEALRAMERALGQGDARGASNDGFADTEVSVEVPDDGRLLLS